MASEKTNKSPSHTPRELIVKTLKEKAVLKQDVYKYTKNVFDDLKTTAREYSSSLKTEIQQVDKRVIVEYRDRGEFEVELRVAGDIIIFWMHTNVFEFDKSHPIWKSSYVKEDELNSFCGMINIYNFLSDSFKYNRFNDIGYLIARIFINREGHFFVEGKRQLGFLYNDLANNTIDKKSITDIIESAILYCLDFDLFTPAFDAVKEVTVSELQEAHSNMQIKTGKRLGFRFQADTDSIED
jgi:hypothetical protein